MSNFRNLILMALVAFTFVACDKDEPEITTASLDLNITGLEDLGDDYAYEGWIMVDGAPQSAGIFTVDNEGNLSASSFDIDAADLEKATAYILTIEPSPDSDPAPSSVHILAGDFSGDNASLTVEHDAAIGNDFTTSSGKYILATPTDGMMNNENSGVWFLNIGAAGPEQGLDLPTLPVGWAYEGWAVIEGQPVSTGTFTSLNTADDAAPFSGTMDGPPYPGEDFLVNAPEGLSFPTDLSEATIVVSVEPVPDNSPNPFLLKPLVGNVASGAADHVPFDLGNNAANTNPTGTVTK